MINNYESTTQGFELGGIKEKCIDAVIDNKLYSFKNATYIAEDKGFTKSPKLWITNKGNWFLTECDLNANFIRRTVSKEEARAIILGDIEAYYKVYDKYFPNDPIEEA